MQPGGSGDPKTRTKQTPIEMTQAEFARREGKSKNPDSTEFYSESIEAAHTERDGEEPRERGEKSS